MYFLYKKGVYGHGVFWIGEDLGEGMLEADHAANMDEDNYHNWILYEFKGQEDDDYENDHQHEKVYTGVRSIGDNRE